MDLGSLCIQFFIIFFMSLVSKFFCKGAVEDWQISASSTKSSKEAPSCSMRYARIFQPTGNAWCAGNKRPLEWLQVDLGVPTKITSLMTQGRADGKEWVKSYLVSHSMDAFHWSFCQDTYGSRQVFAGNVDSHSIKQSYFRDPVIARFVRIHVLEWHGHPSMRLEVVGCQECNKIISSPPKAQLTASSFRPWHKQLTCTPEDGHIYSPGAWCPKKKNVNQWLQVDLGPPTTITGITTKGRGDGYRKHWVTFYVISYSNDSLNWNFYKDDNHLDPKVFGGNMDKNTERRHYFNQIFVARYVRIHPTAWNKRSSMRVGLIGCPHKGDCGQGFFRVYEDSECVENLAYKRKTWINDKRQSWAEWKYGHSSLAVDGDLDTQLEKCAILDNYYVDKPVWMVDLGNKRMVRGVIVVTWQGKGQDRANLYRKYVYNLENMTIYVQDKPRVDDAGTNSSCASVSRQNNAIFQQRLHFECSQLQDGRYIYVHASGIANTWNRLFSAVLCEVMVY
ncbi:lactadherin-like isoform X2 [Tachypleus tridentatus]|uniref:lactadherin-like isoform X2 n=1 Tax=Tachypleus tridentatus TaxID=6853 RepID=UPI003FD2AD7E